MAEFVAIDEVLQIHEAMLKAAGGTGGVRDFALLHSAVERPKATFGGKDLYPTLFTKAAALLQSLCMNHAFTDGNKRTAFESTKRFLWRNGYRLKTLPAEGADFMVLVDNQKLELPTIARRIKVHSEEWWGQVA